MSTQTQTLGWRKSSHSLDPDGHNCVEVAADGAALAVRDSKDPDGPRHSFTPAAFSGLVTDIRRGVWG